MCGLQADEVCITVAVTGYGSDDIDRQKIG